ncbi:hypothetical protein PHYBOEH_009500 [Phytophthora boehmeriae]|uniref:Glutathione S-transferase n=1 Tax=Phytophthora boehmeriae TaxID=109152 RepID=A0A8T1XF14_9STRA|nr:hypothetical protein PHYBOEH_009500 [Phytophthora boehmeriae]
MSMFPSIKLTYFTFPGRAEHVRLAFYIGGVPFEDNRVSNDEFTVMKDSLPLGQLPILEVDGEVMTQSHAILRYAGRLGGLYPTSVSFAACKVDEVLHALTELEEKMAPCFRENDPDKKKAICEELTTVTLPWYAKLIEARIAKMQELPMFRSGNVYVHDVAIYTLVKSIRAGTIKGIPATVLDGYNMLHKTFDKIAEHPKVKEWYSLPHHTPKLKLTYWPIHARAEPIRLAFFIGGIDFEDERVPFEEVDKLLPSLPFNRIPVLDVDGELMSQSMAILRYAGSISRLYPTTNALEAHRVDEIFSLIDDMFNIPDWRAGAKEQDPDKQVKMREALAKGIISKTLLFVEKRLACFNGQFAIGAELTVADLAVYSLVLFLTSGIPGIPTTIADSYPNVQRVFNLVKAHPKVVEWNAAHQ